MGIEIFGYRNPRCREYAIDLGLALQMTNIIRDVWKDFQAGRIYLPQEDLARFHYSEADLAKRQYNEHFLQLMQFEAARARENSSASAAAELPPEDRRAMAPAEIMGSIYRALLRRIELDNFRVFEKEYRLSKLEKAGRIAAQLFKSFLNWPPPSIRLSSWLRNITKNKPMKNKSLKILSAITIASVCARHNPVRARHGLRA